MSSEIQRQQPGEQVLSRRVWWDGQWFDELQSTRGQPTRWFTIDEPSNEANTRAQGGRG